MAIRWRLKSYLSGTHEIYKAKKLQEKITKETGVKISLQNLCNLMSQKPVMIRFKTMEIICTTLKCKLSDFCEVTENDTLFHHQVKQLSAQNTPHKVRAKSNFPDPARYE